MGRIEKLKRKSIQEANERNLGLLKEQSHDYNTIENLTEPGAILRIIRDSLGLFSDNEAPVEAAFMAMAKNPELYFKVKQMWKDNHYDSRSGIDKLTSALKKQFQDWGMRDDDLATAVAGKIDINKIWHKQSILKSLLKIHKWEDAYYKDRGDGGMIEIPELEIGKTTAKTLKDKAFPASVTDTRLDEGYNNILKEEESEDWRNIQSILYKYEKGMDDEQIEDHISNLQSHIQQLIYIMNNR